MSQGPQKRELTKIGSLHSSSRFLDFGVCRMLVGSTMCNQWYQWIPLVSMNSTYLSPSAVWYWERNRPWYWLVHSKLIYIKESSLIISILGTTQLGTSLYNIVLHLVAIIQLSLSNSSQAKEKTRRACPLFQQHALHTAVYNNLNQQMNRAPVWKLTHTLAWGH